MDRARPGRRHGRPCTWATAARAPGASATASASTPTRCARRRACGRRRRAQSRRRPAAVRGWRARSSTTTWRAARSSARARSSEYRDEPATSSSEMADEPPADADAVSRAQVQGLRLGHGDRPERLHRLQRLRGRLPGREQHPGRRQGAGAARPRDALAPHRPLLQRRRRRPARRYIQPVPCLHCENAPCEVVCPVAATVAQRRGPERHGLQPLRRHALLLEQLPVQGAPLQLPRCTRTGTRRASSWCATRTSRAQPRRDGEVHLLRAAHQRGARSTREKRGPRRSRDGEIVTACQQACPAEAIVFGDLNDPDSRVAKLQGAAAQLRAARPS